MEYFNWKMHVCVSIYNYINLSINIKKILYFPIELTFEIVRKIT